MPTPQLRFPGRALRVLIEDPTLVAGDYTAPGGIQATVCAGPHDERETCPLVTEGACPVGPCDVVVTALEGPWAASVRAAWTDAGMPLVDASAAATDDAAQRFSSHIGAALHQLSVTRTEGL
jgi:hypothetical protein